MRSSSPRPASRPASRTKLESVVTTAAKLKAPVYVSDACDDQQAVELFQAGAVQIAVTCDVSSSTRLDDVLQPLQKWLQVPLVQQATEEDLIANSSLQLQYINAEQDNPSFEGAV